MFPLSVPLVVMIHGRIGWWLFRIKNFQSWNLGSILSSGNPLHNVTMVVVIICAVSISENLILPELAISLLEMTSLVTDCPGWWLALWVFLQQCTVLVSPIMKDGELKATCLSCDSETFVLVINLNAVQRWVLKCSPWQQCAVKAKLMMIMFALVVLI